MKIAAELKNVTKVYAQKTVLDNVSLQVYEGEILALLGPNGSGKSTILKIMAFLESATSGEVKFKGETVNAKNAEKLRLQSTLVFQKTTLFDMSVYDNVAYGLKVRKVPKKEQDSAIKEALRIVKLEGFEKRPAKKISGGEQQRVAIARALITDPDIIFADEPTAAIDEETATAIMDVFKSLKKEGKTIIVSTHDKSMVKEGTIHLTSQNGVIQRS